MNSIFILFLFTNVPSIPHVGLSTEKGVRSFGQSENSGNKGRVDDSSEQKREWQEHVAKGSILSTWIYHSLSRWSDLSLCGWSNSNFWKWIDEPMASTVIVCNGNALASSVCRQMF